MQYQTSTTTKLALRSGITKISPLLHPGDPAPPCTLPLIHVTDIIEIKSYVCLRRFKSFIDRLSRSLEESQHQALPALLKMGVGLSTLCCLAVEEALADEHRMLISSLETPKQSLASDENEYLEHQWASNPLNKYDGVDRTAIDIDEEFANDPDAPYIMMAGTKLYKCMQAESSLFLLEKLAGQKLDYEYDPFHVYPCPVAYLDQAERDRRAPYFGPPAEKYYFGTISNLLRTAREDAKDNRGTLFVFSDYDERADCYAHDAPGVIGHEWAGILVKRDREGPESWVLNIFCTSAQFHRDGLEFMNLYPGRQKLWNALHERGFKINEINYSYMESSTVVNTCVLQTWMWMYYASRVPGELWNEDESWGPRLHALELELLDRGDDLFDMYERRKRGDNTKPLIVW